MRWSNGIDSYLSGKQEVSKSSDESYARIRLGPVINQDSVSNFFNFDMRLKLPNTRNRLRLVIESDGDALFKQNKLSQSSKKGSMTDSILKSKFSTAIRYVKKQWGARFDAGILVNFPLDPFLRFRFRQDNDNSQSNNGLAGWRWWQEEGVFAYYSKGIGVNYGTGVNHALSESVEFGSDLGVSWLDQEGAFYSNEGLFVQHMVDQRNSFRYQLSFFQSGVSRLKFDSFLYYLQYQRQLHKNWLIAKVTPQVTYQADNDYRPDPSLTLSLEILFGGRYLD